MTGDASNSAVNGWVARQRERLRDLLRRAFPQMDLASFLRSREAALIDPVQHHNQPVDAAQQMLDALADAESCSMPTYERKLRVATIEERERAHEFEQRYGWSRAAQADKQCSNEGATEFERAQADEIAAEVGQEVGELGDEVRTQFDVHVHPPHEQTRRPVRGGKRAAEKGNAITRIDRYAVDGMVFDRRKPGGSVLIDNSGSMALAPDAIKDAIRGFPALTVAMYSGSWRGRLCVLALRGQLGDLESCESMGGNVIDIESLAWLARQPEPRIWVSDGMVCGGLVDALGGSDGAARDVITGLCARRKIVRVPTFEEAVKVLERGTVRGTGYLPRDPEFIRGISLGR